MKFSMPKSSHYSERKKSFLMLSRKKPNLSDWKNKEKKIQKEEGKRKRALVGRK